MTAPRPTRVRRVRRITVVSAIFALLLVQVAAAAWLVSSAPGAAAARAASVPQVTGLTALFASGKVDVAWQPATLPGGASVQGYTVLAYSSGGDPRTPGGTCATQVSGTSCSDTTAPAGSWDYKVTAKLAGWTGPQSLPVSVTVATGTNEIVAENALPGSPASEWDVSGAGDPSIQGFATDISAAQGQTVDFKIDTNAPAYSIDIYRLGWYGGDGARKVATVQPSATLPQSQPSCLKIDGTTNDNLIDCGNWAVSASWTVPANAVSGIYIARLKRADTNGASHIVFVVRDDNGHSDLLFQTSDTTWQAYNRYGGYSLYDGPGHAHKVSYNRPFTTRDAPTEDWLFNSEYPMLRWLERNGYDVSYSTDVDSDRRGSEILEHRAFLSVGHDEYWSAGQRANVEAARAAGVNLAFFSGNESYWKTRWEPSTAGGASTDYRTLVSYKEGDAQGSEHYDCQGNFACDPDPTQWTGLWRQNAPGHDGGRPENALSGQISWGDATTAIQVPASAGGLRFWRNAGITGDTTLAANTLGYEFDWEQAAYASSYPPGRITLSDTTAVGKNHRMSLYRAPSGALVFGAGTVQWSWGLDATHDRGPSPVDARMQQATVNVLADMAAQPRTLQTDLTGASASTDATAPTSIITSPITGGTVPAGSSLTVTGTAADTGGLVAGVEVSTDDGATWHAATGGATWQYTFTTPVATGSTLTLISRATDDSLNTGSASPAVSVTTAPKVCDPATPCSIYPASSPAASDANDGQGIELGVRFQADAAGRVTGIRFFKPGTATGEYTGRLYTNAGTTPLGSSAATSVSGSGWKVLPLTTPVDITPGETYVASYYSPSGQFAYTAGTAPGNLNTAIVNPPLTAPAHATGAPNAVYKYGGGFPDSTPNPAGANYWADVTFETGTDTTSPTVTSRSPAPATVGVPLDATVSATFSEPIDPATVTSATFTLTGPGTTPVPGTVNAAGTGATLTPTSALALNTTYTATLKGGASGAKDVAGNALEADVTWTFTTTAVTTYTLFGDVTPGLTTDANDYELGTRFTSSVDGLVSGVRFYKGPQNTGTHTGRLWNATTAALLGTVTFTSETATGWQTASFDTPIPITAGTQYIVSYSVPVGYYAFQANFFTSGSTTSGPLTALQSTPLAKNGIFSETPGQFPTVSFNDVSYFVDVVFAVVPDTTAPAVSSTTPADGATGVPVSANVTATFSEPVKASTVSGTTFTLTGPGNTAVPAAVSAAGATVTLNPTADLAPGTTYTATLKGGASGITDEAGNALAADVTWSFTTAEGTPQDYTIFGTTTGGASFNDGQPIEVGVKLRTSQAGSITKVRFLKLATAGGTFTGRVYPVTGGAPLGQGLVTLASGTTGWQEIPLDAPVAVSAGTTYVATYLSSNGDYVSTNGALSSAVTKPPLTALANGTDGPNGVYRYGGGFPDQSCGSCNGPSYWVDVVLSSGPLPPDTTPPTISSRTPASGATDVSPTTGVDVTFSEAVKPDTVTASTFTLTGPSGAVSGARSVNGSTLTFTPTVTLTGEATYTVLVKGGPGGITDLAGNPLEADDTWSFTVRAAPAPRPDPNVGPGGPVLAVKGSGIFGSYLPEIMRAEGLNLFTVGGSADLTASGLAPYKSVVLGETSLTGEQVNALTDWVTAGGNLVALRPDAKLAGLLGLTDTPDTLSEGYLKVDTATAPGAGIVGETIQFHGTADRYGVQAGTQVVATLYSDAATVTTSPAVTLRSVGTAGGSAAAFTFDLARSVVLTRQGNPAWVNQHRDGQDGPIRADNLFYGNMTGDPQPDYVDLSKVAIPQADEQQRLLANVLTQTTLDALPLPRLWYLPRGEKAAIVMTADEHDSGNVPARFDQEITASPNGCSVDDWECIRSTSYLYPSYPSMTATQASTYQGQGFEIALHPNTSCQSPSRTQFADLLTTQLGDLAIKYPGIDPSVTSRNHCIAWTDYTTIPEELAKQGIHLDTNYYYWPDTWVNNNPGMFTGSGFPQRFATTSGDLVDVYQATTQMTDESGQSYPYNAVTLMDRAITLGYYGAFVANLHSDNGSSTQYNADVVAAAKARGVPVISAKQLLTWTDGRNASSFGNLAWNAGTGRLTFTVQVGAGARGLESMLPLHSAGGTLTDLSGPSGAVTPQTRTVKGVEYAVFPAAAGSWTATYAVAAPDTTPPTVTATMPADNATAVSVNTTVTATFSEPVTAVSGSTFTLNAGGTPVAGTVTYATATRSATFTPASPLATGTAYTATLSPGITDVATTPNPLVPVTWSFTTAAEVSPPAAAAVSDSSSAEFGQGTGTDTTVVNESGGEVILTPDVQQGFDGTGLPTGWSALGWTGGGATVTGGTMAVDGARVYTDAYFAPGRSLDFVATFGAEAFQHAGLATDAADLNGYYWAFFSTSNTTNTLYARTNNNGAVTDTVLPGSWIGSPHQYHIDWNAGDIVFSIDGTVVHTAPVAISNQMRPFYSDYNAGGQSVRVDWVRQSPYAGSAEFVSRVFDAGQPSTWGAVDWTVDLPAGTSLQVQVRAGDTATPTGTWTDVAKGQAPTVPAARYLQYRLVLGTTDSRVTPTVSQVTIGAG